VWWLVALLAVTLGSSGARAQEPTADASASPVARQMATARAFALAHRYPAAIACYDSVLATDPRNLDAAGARAQVIAWSGRLAAADSIYRTLIAAGAGPDAEKGLAQVLAWEGRLTASETIYRAVVARDSMDTEAWTGLAQVLVWEGRPRPAARAVERGLAAHPDDGEARTQWLAIRPLVSGAIRPVIIGSGDSEHNTSLFAAVEADALAPWSGRLSATAQVRDAWRGLAHGTSTEGRLATTWGTAGDRLTLRAEGGVAYTDGVDGATRAVATLIGSAHAGARLGSAITVGVGGAVDAFDETAALIARGIRQSSVGADFDSFIGGEDGGRFDATGGYATVGGGARLDERIEGAVSIRSGPWHGLSLGAGAHGYGYLRPDSVDGYFTPASYLLAEGIGRWSSTNASGWIASVELGAGAQRIALFGAAPSVRPAERVQASAGYRVAPGTEFLLGGGYSRAASPVSANAASANDYSGYTLSASARIRIP